MQVRAVFAELERNLTAERIREGLAVRRARGVKLGRRRTLDYSKLDAVAVARKHGASWGNISKSFGGSPGAWSRAVSRA